MGFPLEHVRVGVHLWHGDLDTNVPLPVAEAVARALPTAQLTVVPGEGHLSLTRHLEAILGDLTRQPAAAER